MGMVKPMYTAMTPKVMIPKYHEVEDQQVDAHHGHLEEDGRHLEGDVAQEGGE